MLVVGEVGSSEEVKSFFQLLILLLNDSIELLSLADRLDGSKRLRLKGIDFFLF